MALIKKNSEVPSYAPIYAAIDKFDIATTPKKSPICKIESFFLYIMAPTFSVYSATFIQHKLIMKTNKVRLFCGLL